jgi:RND family efflux transporter MFP subunit
VELEVPELEKELAQKEAGVQQAKAEVTQAEAGVRVAQAMQESAEALVEEAQATVERAEADYKRWKAELDRITDLASRGAVTEKLVDETKNKFGAAEAARKEVTAKIKSAEANQNESGALVEKAEADLGAAQAKLGVAQAEHDRTQTLIGFAEIRAPFDGRVAARSVDIGHLVNAGSSDKEALLVIVNTSTVRIYVDVPEIDAVHIQPKAEASIQMPSLAGSLEGAVTRTTWVLNEATRTLRTEIDVPNEDGRLRPGMYAHARLKVAERPDALVLPKSALIAAGGETSVWRIETDGTLRRNMVKTGIEASGEVEIVSGLTGDEDLIGVNVAAFREGQQVEVVAPPAK